MINKCKLILSYVALPLFWTYYRLKRKEFPNVCNSIDTLKTLIGNRISFSRFGDGEFNIILGKGIGFQKIDSHLQKELLRILTTPNEKCAIGIPNIFSGLDQFNLNAKIFWLYKIFESWHGWSKFLNLNKYLDSISSRFYMDLKDKSLSRKIISLWRELWNDREIIIIEGDKTKMGIGNDLFSNAKSIQRIVCPSKNAFEKYDEILRTASKVNKESLILIALGPTASILAYDLSKLGFQAIDTGHLDIEYNWMLMNASKKVGVKGRAVNEVINDHYEDIKDDLYCSQIIKHIS